MKLHPEKTDRGWEMADETGTFESLQTSKVYPSKSAATTAATEANYQPRCFDELRALEAMRG